MLKSDWETTKILPVLSGNFMQFAQVVGTLRIDKLLVEIDFRLRGAWSVAVEFRRFLNKWQVSFEGDPHTVKETHAAAAAYVARMVDKVGNTNWERNYLFNAFLIKRLTLIDLIEQSSGVMQPTHLSEELLESWRIRLRSMAEDGRWYVPTSGEVSEYLLQLEREAAAYIPRPPGPGRHVVMAYEVEAPKREITGRGPLSFGSLQCSLRESKNWSGSWDNAVRVFEGVHDE